MKYLNSILMIVLAAALTQYPEHVSIYLVGMFSKVVLLGLWTQVRLSGASDISTMQSIIEPLEERLMPVFRITATLIALFVVMAYKPEWTYILFVCRALDFVLVYSARKYLRDMVRRFPKFPYTR